jgi:hypothetical protein
MYTVASVKFNQTKSRILEQTIISLQNGDNYMGANNYLSDQVGRKVSKQQIP